MPLSVSGKGCSKCGKATFIVDTLAVTRKAPKAVDKKISRVRLRLLASAKEFDSLLALRGRTLKTRDLAASRMLVPLSVTKTCFLDLQGCPLWFYSK